MLPPLSLLIVPGEGAASTHLPGGLRAPAPSFPLSVAGRSVCDPQRLGAGRTPDSPPGAGRGRLARCWGALPGLGRELAA